VNSLIPVSSSDNNKVRLIYILAASHSGSTLLAMLLGAHPDVCTIGEIKATYLGAPEQYRCSCRRKIKKCPFWNGISDEMAKRGFSFDITNAGTDIRSGATPYILKLLKPLHRGLFMEMLRDLALALSPAWSSRLSRIQKLNEALVESVLQYTGEKVIVDSSKIGIRLKYLLRNPNLDVKVIRLIRDGRGVALTYVDPEQFADASDPSLRGGGMGGNREKERLSMKMAALEWRRSNEEAESILKSLNASQWMEVRYESLCLNPGETLKKIFTFIGVDPGAATTDFRSVEHHVVGNGMRLDSRGEIRLDERWKTVLNEVELKEFDIVAGGISRRLGYL